MSISRRAEHMWLAHFGEFCNWACISIVIGQVIVKRPMHSEKLTVCNAALSGGFIGPCFFEYGQGIIIWKICCFIELFCKRYSEWCNIKISDVNWPARCCDLIHFCFIFCVYAKVRAYGNISQTLDQLKANICEAIVEIVLELPKLPQ